MGKTNLDHTALQRNSLTCMARLPCCSSMSSEKKRADVSAHLKLSARATVKFPLPQYSSSMSPVLPADTRRAQPSIFWHTPAEQHARVVGRLRCSLAEVRPVVQAVSTLFGMLTQLARKRTSTHTAIAQGPQRRQCMPARLRGGSSHRRSCLKDQVRAAQTSCQRCATQPVPPPLKCTSGPSNHCLYRQAATPPVLCGLPHGCVGDEMQQD